MGISLYKILSFRNLNQTEPILALLTKFCPPPKATSGSAPDRGRVLDRFMELMAEIKTFLSEREEYPQLQDCRWLLNLAFLTDMTTKLNDLNCDFTE